MVTVQRDLNEIDKRSKRIVYDFGRIVEKLLEKLNNNKTLYIIPNLVTYKVYYFILVEISQSIKNVIYKMELLVMIIFHQKLQIETAGHVLTVEIAPNSHHDDKYK